MKKLTRKEKVRTSQFNKKLEQAKSIKKIGIGFMVAGFSFFLFFGNIWINRNQEIKKEDLISIEGTVTKEIELEWGKNVGNSIKIQLNEYPKIDYKIDKFTTSIVHVYSLQNSIKIGDKIQIDIMKDDFAKIDPNRQKRITIFGIRDDKNEYLNIDNYNRAKKKDRNSISMYLLLGFSFWMFGYGLYLVMKNRN